MLNKSNINIIKYGFDKLNGEIFNSYQEALNAIDKIINPLSIFRDNFKKNCIGSPDLISGDIRAFRNVHFALNSKKINQNKIQIFPEIRFKI
jgi:hypothetical protein